MFVRHNCSNACYTNEPIHWQQVGVFLSETAHFLGLFPTQPFLCLQRMVQTNKKRKKVPQKGNIQQPLAATQPWYAEDHLGMNNTSNFEADWLQQQRTTQGATAVS